MKAIIAFYTMLIITILLFASYNANCDTEIMWGYLCDCIDMPSSDCSNLCWAACMQAVLEAKFIDAQQCELQVDKNFIDGDGSGFCCSEICDDCTCSGCNEPNFLGGNHNGSVEQIFFTYYSDDISTSFSDTRLDTTTMRNAISSGNPIMMAYPVPAGGHVILIVGYAYFNDKPDTVQLIYLDPNHIPASELLKDSYPHLTANNADDYLTCNISTSVTSYNNPITRLAYFIPYIDASSVTVKFATNFEDNTHHFLLQKFSRSSGRFKTIAPIMARGNESKETYYSYKDKFGRKDDIYRLIEVENGGARHILSTSETFQENLLLHNKKIKRHTRDDLNKIREKTKILLSNSAEIRQNLKSPTVFNYDWIAIFPDSFESDVSDLISWRWMQGFNSAGKTIEEINSEYGGIKQYVHHLWETQNGSLKYIFLVGTACDTSFSSCVGHNIIPIDRFSDGARSSDGTTNYESDVEVGDINDDGLPEIAVGRIPAECCYDVASYVNKVISYEQSSAGDWFNDVSFFINAISLNSCSPALIDSFAQLLVDCVPTQYNLHYNYVNDSLLEYENLDAEKRWSITISEFNKGRALMLGLGSSASDWNFVDWLNDFTSSFDMDSLNTNGAFPFLVGASCEIGDVCHLSINNIREIVKELLFSPDRGIIAAFAPTGGTWQEGNYEISKYLLKYLYDWGAKSLGYACMNAQKLVMSRKNYLEPIARSYLFIGDPAIKLKGGVVCAANTDRDRPIKADYLMNNYPNPFNPTTIIKYKLAEDSNVDLSIYDVSGRLVKTLVHGFQVQGEHTIIWNGMDNSGKAVSSGIYFYRLKSKHYTETKKLVLLK